MKRFKPIPLTELLDEELLADLRAEYTDFEKLTPIEDIYLSEPSMMGVMDIQDAAGTPRSLICILQETLLTKKREVCWSRNFIERLPASVALPLALACRDKLEDLFNKYNEHIEKEGGSEKKS